MTQEEKDLFLKDLCARLPYGVILNCCNLVGEKLYTIDNNGLVNNDYDLEEVKPYLFPLSSMTEEQEKEWRYTLSSDGNITYETVGWLNKNNFDYNWLIPKGLAIDATGKNIY